ncbi:MAG: GDP-L-fucose synthase, partial [Pseudomonadota bacterium]
ASVFLMQQYDAPQPINIGSGQEMSIHDFATVVARIVGYEGDIVCDASHPDGTPRKRLDISRLTQLGWSARISLEDGLTKTYQDYMSCL